MSDFWNQFLQTHPVASEDIQAGLFPIVQQQMLVVEGADSSKFMQGQFTCNLTEVTPQSFRRGACCNPKGRMVSSFTLAQSGENQYLLSLAKGMAEPTLNHLKKYMVFFKTTMTASDWVMAGLRGNQAADIIEGVFGQPPAPAYGQIQSELGLVLTLPFDAGYELWLPAESAEQTLTTIAADMPVQTTSGWSQVLVAAGLAQVTAESSEEHIPQMINLGQTNGISFNKGCYTGQEIVARMQYLGKLKRHLYRIGFQATQTPAAHTPIHAADKASAVGNIVNLAHLGGDQWQALAVLEDKQLEHFSDLHIEGCKQLELLDLPYEIVPEAE